MQWRGKEKLPQRGWRREKKAQQSVQKMGNKKKEIKDTNCASKEGHKKGRAY